MPKRKASGQAAIGTLDSAAVGEELKMTMQAIDEHERLLADHRKAVLAGTATGVDVDSLHATLASLRANLPVQLAEHARLIGAD